MGFEPVKIEWHSIMFPLHHDRLVPEDGIPPPFIGSKPIFLVLEDSGINLQGNGRGPCRTSPLKHTHVSDLVLRDRL